VIVTDLNTNNNMGKGLQKILKIYGEMKAIDSNGG
jgi:hypothetical protein